MQTIMKRSIYALLVLLACFLPQAARAQTFTLNSTTLSSAMTSTTNTAVIASASAATGSSFGSVAVGQWMSIDQEVMPITAVSSTTITVTRAVAGRIGHPSGSVVYIGTSNAFAHADPKLGVCALASQGDPVINVENGRIWRCIGSQWLNVIDAFQLIGPGNCFYSVTTGTLATPSAVTNVGVYEVKSNGLINSSATAPGTPVMQVATTNAAVASINTVSCAVPIPTRANPSRGVYVADATWVYGVQQNDVNTTQVATEASGLLNGIVAFGKVVFPTAAATETSSLQAQARWDTGTMVLTPVKTAFNATVTTAGRFYTQKIAPAAPVAMTTDLTGYYVNFTVLCATTVATSIQVAGVLVHYQLVTGM